MIVLDEQLLDTRIIEDFGRWYKGAVITVLDLRPKTQINDDAIPSLLRKVKQPTFITINYTDFWKKIATSNDYGVVCLKLSSERSLEASDLVRGLFKMKEFSIKKARMGKVISWSDGKVSYYS